MVSTFDNKHKGVYFSGLLPHNKTCSEFNWGPEGYFGWIKTLYKVTIYVIELHNLQKRESLFSKQIQIGAIQFHKQKIKIHFAMQVFSKSVVEALQICKDYFKMQSGLVQLNK